MGVKESKRGYKSIQQSTEEQRLLKRVKESEKANNHKQPFGILQEGSEAIEQFKKAKTTDMKNERRPT